MSPYNIHDDLPGDESKGADAKHPVPGDNATDPDRRRWLAWAFTVPPGWRVGEVVRYGGASCTPMTIEVAPPGDGGSKIVRLEEERDAAKNGTLRHALTRDAGLKAAAITNAKVAGDAYYVLCKLARVVGSSDPRDETREWVDGYREEANRLPLSFAKGELYETLDALRRYPYSKRQINLWLAAIERYGGEAGEPPRPPLAIDTARGGEWTSITHLSTYVRWGRDQPGTIRNDALAGRVVELGGERWAASAWDRTDRQRERRIITVLVRLPSVENDVDEGEETV
jgi:hypothetical protein